MLQVYPKGFKPREGRVNGVSAQSSWNRKVADPRKKGFLTVLPKEVPLRNVGAGFVLPCWPTDKTGLQEGIELVCTARAATETSVLAISCKKACALLQGSALKCLKRLVTPSS